MYYANDENGIRVDIRDAVKDMQYVCPVCNCPMIIKRGKIITHHFAHKTNICCDPWYASKTSKWHRKMQNKFPVHTQEKVIWNEDKTEFHVADVYVNTKGKQYVFEFQHSDLPVDEFISRTQFYVGLGCSVVWIFDYQNNKKPKCIFYEDVPFSDRLKHVIWPGRDRVRSFDSPIMRTFLANSINNISVLFYVNTGQGQRVFCEYSSGFQTYKWEYVNPFDRETYYIKPDFVQYDSLSDFWASFFTENEIDERIREIVG